MQPTTLLALIEQGLKVYTSIVKRVFRSLGQEFTRIFNLNRRYPNEEAYAEIIDFQPPQSVVEQIQQVQQMAQQAQQQGLPPPPPPPPSLMQHLNPPTMEGDYQSKGCDIVPVADPSQVTDMQRMAKAQLIRETAVESPVVNKEQAMRRVYQAANIEDIDQLIIPAPAGPDPLMVEDATAEIQKKRASAVKDLALADKAAVETEEVAQRTAVSHAQIAGGQMDADAALNTETQRLANNKTEREMALKERQQDSAEKQAAAQARGEAA